MTHLPNNIIVTASDGYYFRTLCQLIYTFRSRKEYQNSELICYDLGFSIEQKNYLESLKTKTPNLSVRAFDFTQYPYFVGLAFQTYSFKPIIVKKIFEEKKGNVLWLDSATILIKPLDDVWKQLNDTGLYTPIGGGSTLFEWTLQKTLDYMEVPKAFYHKKNISGGICGFSYTNARMRQLVADWEKYALIHECIKPETANRSNHRDDQSLLTILVYKLRQKTGIHLTKDEVNISSVKPVGTYSVMNKLKPKFPQYLNFFSVLYFNIYRKLDIIINRFKS